MIGIMSDPYLDHLPSHEREKIRKRLRSPEEYERMREKVKGPEDLEREMQHNAEFAEVKLALETEPMAQEKARNEIQEFASERGVENAFETSSDRLQDSLRKGQFDVVLDEKSQEPKLAVNVSQGPQNTTSMDVSIGNVSEIFHLKPALQQQIMASFKIRSQK